MIYGNNVDDVLVGGPGDDQLSGDNGDDTYELDADSPVVYSSHSRFDRHRNRDKRPVHLLNHEKHEANEKLLPCGFHRYCPPWQGNDNRTSSSSLFCVKSDQSQRKCGDFAAI